MAKPLLKFAKALWKLAVRQDGQDLVEYALVLALVALGATAGMKTLASDIDAAFSHNALTFASTLNLQ
jgi:pilus assembly protein Flp/PilA